ncbi:MAG: hypothetical protein NTV79_07180 [Candidatus Aureabacteria bacterium]|nr:hypothetical protein [Candidatus Auribacterota bacterium]
MGWLVTPLGLLVGALGLLREIKENRKAAVWFFILLVVSFAGVFVWRQLVHQRYMWAARRFAVVAVPGTLLFASRLLSDSLRSRFRVVRRLVPPIMILLVLSTAWGSRIIWRHREYGGAVSYCEKIAGDLAGAGLVAVRGDYVSDKLPSVLDLIYGFRVLPLYRDNPEAFRLLAELVKRAPGEKAFLLSSGPPPPMAGLEFEPEGEYPYHCGLLERRDDRLPRIIDADAPDGNFTVRIYRIVPARSQTGPTSRPLIPAPRL